MFRRPIAFVSAAVGLLLVAVLAWMLRPYIGSNRPTSHPASPNTLAARSADPASAAPGKSAVSVEAPSPIRFTEILEHTGVDFVHQTGTSPERPFPAANGSGIAALDYDLDGNYDLYFATGTPLPLDPSRPEPRNRIYRNQGEWRFRDVTEPSGLGHNGYSAGLAVGDVDGDGFPDVYVACYGANRLYHNQGDGTYRRIEESAGVDDPQWGTSAAFLDYDNDALPDLYVCNYAQWSLETNRFCGDRERNVRIYCSPTSVEPAPHVFYRNSGDGIFADATKQLGLADRLGRGQGVLAADVDGDALIDLYVTNDLHPNFLYLNEGGRRFRDATDSSGAGFNFAGDAQAGMGVDAADVNRDGRIDLFVTNYEGEHNTLYENLGEAVFHDVSERYGVAADGLPWIGWGTTFADFDLDGWDDLFVTNGHTDENMHDLGRDSPWLQPPLIWRNTGRRFERLRQGIGSYFDSAHPGRALAAADLDNDGDRDLVVGHQDAAPAALRNERLSTPGDEPCSIQLHLVGTRSNRDAIGAQITLRTSTRTVRQQVKGGGSYLSANDLRQILAVLPGESGLQVEIRWPAGGRSVLSGLERGGSYRVVEPLDESNEPHVLARASERGQ